MKPRRTARSQMMKSTTGPMKGRALSSAGLRCTTAAGAAGGVQGLAGVAAVDGVSIMSPPGRPKATWAPSGGSAAA
jgi:hypothetical protein